MFQQFTRKDLQQSITNSFERAGMMTTQTLASRIRDFIPELEEMIGNLDLREFLIDQAKSRIPEMLDWLIIGPPGTGKTASMMSFHRRVTGILPADRPMQPLNYSAPDGTSGRTWKINGRSTHVDDIENVVEYSQNTTGHDIIVVDEFGYLYDRGAAESLRSALDSSKVLVVATSQEFSKVLRRNESEAIATERLVAMMRRFHSFSTDVPEPDELTEWTIRAIREWGIKIENDDPDIVSRLVRKANGVVGWVILQLAHAAATPGQLLRSPSIARLDTML